MLHGPVSPILANSLRQQIQKSTRQKPDNGQKFIFVEVLFPLQREIMYQERWNIEFY